MTNNVIYSAPSSWVDALSATTDLDNKATNTAITAGPAIDNRTNKILFIEFSLRLGTINPTNAPYWELHLLQELDDGSFADRSNQTLVDLLGISGSLGSAARGSKSELIRLGPSQYKPQLVNQMGVTTNTTAGLNFFKYRTYTYNNNG
jgi:hypothetical protein